jgi:hypothetical protein
MIENITNPAAPAKNVTPASTPAAKPNDESAKAPTVDTAPISPRLRFDAVSGVVVTEFLKNGNNVQAQVPSVAVLAYLRAGLGPDGRSKEKIETHHAEPSPTEAAPAANPAGV